MRALHFYPDSVGRTVLMIAAADQKLVCGRYLAGYKPGRPGPLVRENDKPETGLTDYFNGTTHLHAFSGYRIGLASAPTDSIRKI